MVGRKLVIEAPNSVEGYPYIKGLKIYDENGDEIQVDASSNERIEFVVNHKDIIGNVEASSTEGEYLAFRAFSADTEWRGEVPEPEANPAEWSMNLDTLITLGRDIHKVSLIVDKEIEGDYKLYCETARGLEEVGVFGVGEGSTYYVETPIRNYIVAQKGNKVYYRPSGLDPAPLFPRIDVVPYMVSSNKVTGKTSSTSSYTAQIPGYAVLFAEGGTASQAGNGRPTATFKAPKDPVMSYTKMDYDSGSANWYYGTEIRVYYLYAGETVSVTANCASGNSYTYLFTGAVKLEYLEDRYEFDVVKKSYNANTTLVSYTHEPDPKDKYLLFLHFVSGGNTSAGKPTLTSSDNSKLIFPEINHVFSYSTGGTAYSSARLFRLPPDTAFTASAQGVTSSSTRSPGIFIAIRDKFA